MRSRISIRGFVRPWVHPSVRPSIRPSVRWSVCWSVRWSVGTSRVSQISRKSRLWDNKTSGNNEFKLIQLNSSKFKKIQENSFILTYIGRIFVRIELVSLFYFFFTFLPSFLSFLFFFTFLFLPSLIFNNPFSKCRAPLSAWPWAIAHFAQRVSRYSICLSVCL